jgi:serine/threonine protein kinase
VDRIGVGGFATVWLYHDDELDSDVAVKALADNWAQRFDIRERFLEEARILRAADSDHVVRVYDIGEADGTPYFVMSYADRGSLGGLLETGLPLPVEQAVGLVEQAGVGLSVLHRQGVIHRDIKPANLLLRSTDDGGVRVLVADLGVAKAMLHASGLTQVVGTPAYMAPEQATGEGIDVRADVHALGAVAYHMLTGQLIRQGGIASLMAPRLPQAPSTISTLPKSMDHVLLRAIHPSREQRWPDVGSFTRALRASADGDGPAPEPTVPRRVIKVRTELSAPPWAPRPEPVAVPEAPRSGSRWLLVLLCLLVLTGTFAASYAVTNQLR